MIISKFLIGQCTFRWPRPLFLPTKKPMSCRRRSKHSWIDTHSILSINKHHINSYNSQSNSWNKSRNQTVSLSKTNHFFENNTENWLPLLVHRSAITKSCSTFCNNVGKWSMTIFKSLDEWPSDNVHEITPLLLTKIIKGLGIVSFVKEPTL